MAAARRDAGERLTGYASLLRYGEAGMVAAACERALARGYRDIKLHEITVPEVRAARRGDRAGGAADGRHQLPVDGVRRRSTWRAHARRST